MTIKSRELTRLPVNYTVILREFVGGGIQIPATSKKERRKHRRLKPAATGFLELMPATKSQYAGSRNIYVAFAGNSFKAVGATFMLRLQDVNVISEVETSPHLS